MANTIRIKRRSSDATAPTTAQAVNGELAFNESNDILYYGEGGDASASNSVIKIGGSGAFITTDTTQNSSVITGTKTFTTSTFKLTGGSSGQALTTDGSGNLSFSLIPVNKAGDSMTGLLTLSANPSSEMHAATKQYVDSVASGLDVKASCRAASTANLAVTYSATGGSSGRGEITGAPNSLDGVALAANDRVLLKNQTAGAQNGIWVVSTLGTGSNGIWYRASDFDSDSKVTPGAYVYIEEGLATEYGYNNAQAAFVLTTAAPIVIGGTSGTALTFVQFSGVGQITAGAGLVKTGNTIEVGSFGSGSLTIGADSINLTSGIATTGTYRSVTVDTYGRVTGGTAPTTLSGYGISDTSANLALAITDLTDNLVTIATEQSITGNKTFDGLVTANAGIEALNLTLQPGTEDAGPLYFNSGDLLINQAVNNMNAGQAAIEFNENRLYASNVNNKRALIPTEHFAVITTTRSINSSNAFQNVFDSTNAIITLAPSTTYTFEGLYRIASGTVSHTTQVIFSEVGFGGTAGTWYWFALTHGGTAGNTTRTQDTVHFTTAAGGAVNATSTNALITVLFRGVVTTPSDYNSTVTPQIRFNIAPGGTNQIGIGTFIKFSPIGTNTVQSVGPWS